MAREKAKKPEKKEPSAEERKVLYELLYDSCLFQAHGIVVTNVSEKIGELLRLLGREDLAEIWAEPEKLAQAG